MASMSDNKNHSTLECARGDTACCFIEEILELRKTVDTLTEMVRMDALTGLFNFRFFTETLAIEMERTRRGAQPLAMILLDVDHFKKFNDQWGHELGNSALVHIANLIKLTVRKLDFPCRFGGEEFVILLPNTDLRQAVQVADRLRDMIATTPLQVAGQDAIKITASLGVDQFSAFHSETGEAFTHRVDTWLYNAKHGGRNQVKHPELVAAVPNQSVTTEEKNALFDFLRENN